MTTSLYPPGPTPRFSYSNILRMQRGRLEFFVKLAQDYGDIAYFKIGKQGIYFVNHPDYIKDVLVTNSKNFKKGRGLERARRMLGDGLLTSEGENWMRQRRLAQPAFHRKRISSYAVVMVEYAERTSEGWQDGTTVDMSQEMSRLTLAIVGKTLFDADVENEAAEIGEALTAAMELFNGLAMLPFSEIIEKLPLPSVRRFKKARTRLDETVYRMINERRVSGEDRGDLLSMLLLSHDDEGDGGSMNDLQLRDEAMTIFLAGHETTANALTWTWYLLSQNPAAEAKMQAELEAVLGDRLPTYEDLPRLKYTEMVLSEAMRLYPPAHTMGRRAVGEYKIKDYVVPAGSIVLMSQYVMHQDPRYFPDPHKFEPERWTAEAQAQRPKFSYFPFGGGPRLCIGEPFAWMEGVLLLATLAQKWQPRLVPGHPVELQPFVTLRPKHGMQMRLVRRPAAEKQVEKVLQVGPELN